MTLKELTDSAHPETVLTTCQLAEATGIPVCTWSRWRSQGKSPTYYKIGDRAVRYRVADVRAWLATSRVEPWRS
jgi:predicted DNA-binding transcriptional regulator AlpA